MQKIKHKLPKLNKKIGRAAAFSIIGKPIVTEKTSVMDKCYVFKAKLSANKFAIKQAVEQVFGIEKIKSINTLNVKPRKVIFKGKKGFKSPYKKVYVHLMEKVDSTPVVKSK